MADNNIRITTTVDDSQFNQKISEMQQKIKSLRETGPGGTYSQLAESYRNRGNEQRAQQIEQYRKNADRANKNEMKGFLREQNRELKEIESKQSRIKGIIDRANVSVENRAKAQQNYNKLLKEHEQTAKSIVATEQQLNQLHQSRRGYRPEGMERIFNAFMGGQGKGLGGFGAAGRAFGRMGGLEKMQTIGAGLGIAGSATMAGGQFYKQIATYPERLAQREATTAGMMSEMDRLMYQRRGYEMSLFGPERLKALERAQTRVGAEKVSDITGIAGKTMLGAAGTIGAYGLGGGLIGGIGGFFLGGPAGAVAGAKAGAGIGARYGLKRAGIGAAIGLGSAMTNDRQRSLITDTLGITEDAYKTEMSGVFAGTYEQQLQAERAKSFQKDLAAKFLERESGRFRKLQRGFGLSDQELFMGPESILQRAGRAGYDMDTMTQSMMGIQAGGGPTGVAVRGAQIAAQMQRNLDLTNAPQLMGRISGVTGMDEIKSKDEIIRMYAEGTRIGLDTSEVRDYMQAAVDIGYKSGADVGRVSGFLSAGMEGPGGLMSQRGVEAARNALAALTQQTGEMGGLTGQYQLAEFKSAEMTRALGGKGLSLSQMAYLGGTDVTKIDDDYLRALLEERGVEDIDKKDEETGKTKIDILREQITKSKTRSMLRTDEQEKILKEFETFDEKYADLSDEEKAKERRNLEMRAKSEFGLVSGDQFTKMGLPEQLDFLKMSSKSLAGEITQKGDEKSVLEQFNANISRLTDSLEKQRGVGDAAMMENLTEQSDKLQKAFMSVTTDALKAAGQLSHLATILEKIEDPDARKEIQKTLGEMKELFNKSVADQKPAQTNQQNMSIDPKLVEKQSTETPMMSTEPEGN